MEEMTSNRHTAERPRSYKIRFASHTDLPKIAHIARVTWDDTYFNTISLKNRREFLRRVYHTQNLAGAIDAPGHWFYVAEVNDDIVIGFAHFLRRYHRSQARAELVRFYVLPEFQGFGLGTALMTTGFTALAQAGIEQCFVSVQEQNHLARKLYERHGFEFHRKHGQFLGTQIVTLVEYIRPITNADLEAA